MAGRELLFASDKSCLSNFNLRDAAEQKPIAIIE